MRVTVARQTSEENVNVHIHFLYFFSFFFYSLIFCSERMNWLWDNFELTLKCFLPYPCYHFLFKRPHSIIQCQLLQILAQHMHIKYRISNTNFQSVKNKLQHPSRGQILYAHTVHNRAYKQQKIRISNVKDGNRKTRPPLSTKFQAAKIN